MRPAPCCRYRTAASSRDARGRSSSTPLCPRTPALDEATRLPRTEGALGLLLEAGAALDGSAEPEAALAHLARLAVPRMADVCLVDLLADDGSVRRLAAVRRDPTGNGLAAEPERRAPAPSHPGDPLTAALRERRPVLLPRVEPEWLSAAASYGEHLEWLREVAPRSLMVLPLLARGGVLGAVTLACAEAARHYTPDDLALAEDLARRAALAVDYARLRREAQAAHDARRGVLSGLSHELRTPVQVVIGYTDLLRIGIPEPLSTVASGYVEQIRSAANHLTHMLEQMLTLSRMDAQREGVDLRPVDLAAVVRETASLVEPLAREKGLDYRVQVPDGEVPAVTDPGKVRQILFNLLGNAVKFTQAGEVSLALREVGDRVRIEVRDTGFGIAPDHLERIFEPYWQVERAPSQQREGTGLGLSIVRRLAQLLGGDIAVRSVAGEGSTFTVELPVRAPAG